MKNMNIRKAKPQSGVRRGRWLGAIALMLFCAVMPLFGAKAEVTLKDIGVTTAVPDGWTVVTPDTVAANFSFFEEDTPEIAADVLRSEGVYLVAFSKSGDATLRIIAEEGDSDVALYYDIDRYTPQMRTKIKNDFLNTELWQLTGYKFLEAEWSNKAGQGRMLNLTYNVRSGGEIVARGRRVYTIHGGRAFSLDLQVRGRQVTAEEAKVFANFVAKTKFPQDVNMPLLPVGLALNSPIPEETYKADIALRGETTGGASLEAWLVNSDGESTEVGNTVAAKNGSFRLDVSLPGEGEYRLFLVATLSGYADSETSGWVDYSRKRLPVSFTSFPTGEVYDSQIYITGKTIPGVKIQCMEGDTNKKATTGSNGEFSFKLDRNIVGPRTVTLSFDKDGFDNRRFTAEFNRQWLMEDFAKSLADKVQSLSYANLTQNAAKYVGRIVKYTGEILNVSQNGDRTYIQMGTKQDKNGVWQDRIVAVTEHVEVLLSEGDRASLYVEVTDQTYMFPETNADGDEIEVLLPSVIMLAYEK